MLNVLVTGSFDILHSGHLYFLQRAATYGTLYVGIGPDNSISSLKKRETICKQEERLFMIKSLKCVEGAWINRGIGNFDFFQDKDIWPVKINILVVNQDQEFVEKAEFCKLNNIEYIVLDNKQSPDLPIRSSTQMRNYYGQNR